MGSVLFIKLKTFKYSYCPASYMLYASRKAMSPLIATVLLIAFAVALGAMIMNWSADTVLDNTVDVDSICSSVIIQNTGTTCYSDGLLKFSVKNIGTRKIEAIKLKSSSDIGDLSLLVKDSSMISSESLTREVQFIYTGGNINIAFLPVVDYEGESVDCSGFSQTSLPPC